MTCPKCGNSDFKEVTENLQQKYKSCSNCHYSPALERAEPVDAKTWVEEIYQHASQAESDFIDADVEFRKKETTLTMGKLNKAKRIMEAAQKKVVLADAVSRIVGETESGQITLLIPELGLFQFEYGGFELFKAIGQ